MNRLTASELRYLLAIEEGEDKLRMIDISKKTGVSKPSVLQAVTRLEKHGYVAKEERIRLTEEGQRTLEQYKVVVYWMKDHLAAHCHVPEEIALDDAIKCACVISDVGRANIAKFVEEMKGRR